MFDSPKDVARRLLSTGAQGVGIGHLLTPIVSDIGYLCNHCPGRATHHMQSPGLSGHDGLNGWDGHSGVGGAAGTITVSIDPHARISISLLYKRRRDPLQTPFICG